MFILKFYIHFSSYVVRYDFYTFDFFSPRRLAPPAFWKNQTPADLRGFWGWEGGGEQKRMFLIKCMVVSDIYLLRACVGGTQARGALFARISVFCVASQPASRQALLLSFRKEYSCSSIII